MEEVERLVTSGADIEATDKKGFTPLHLASEVGHLDVVDRLTEAKADLEAIGGCFSRTPLHLAAEKGHCQVVDRLLAAKAAVEAQDQYGRTPLHLAAESGHPATVDRLVAGGATVDVKSFNGQTPLHLAAEYCGHPKLAQRLLDAGADLKADYHGDTPWQCARENHKDDVAFLRGATPAVDEEEGWFPLHSATFDNDVEEVEHQLVGANIEDADKRGFTPLHLASEVGHLDVVDRLTEAKADLEAKGGEYSYTPPLHCAAQSGHPATVDRLLAAGAAVDAKDNNGQTPLHYAAHYGRSEAAQRLVDAGADVDAQDVMRTTPWVLARETGKARQMAPVLRPVYVSSLGGRNVPCGHWPERRVIELKEEAEQKLGCKICELIASSGKPLQERLTLEEDGVNCWDHITAVALVPTDPTESTDHHASGRQSGEFAAGDARGSNQETQGGYLGAVGALGPRSKYDLQDPQQLIRLFLDAKIGLMRLEYLQEMLAADRRFPRRQEADFEVTAAGLPAIVQPSELQRVEIDAVGNMSMCIMDPTPRRVTVLIVSISHVWESMEHPDPHGFQLHQIVQKCPPVTSTRSVWIFYDFSSLYQYGGRTDQQERDFREALEHMHTLYAHEAVKVQIVEELTPETWKRPGIVNAFSEKAGRVIPIPIDQLTANMTPCRLRGWCQAERQWSSLRISLASCVPMPPDLFRRKMEEQGLRFTHHDDKELVMKLQAQVFAEKVLTTRQLMAELLDKDALDGLCEALPFYADLDEIVVTGNLLPRKAAVAVAKTNARSYQMESCGLQDEDVEDVVATLLHCDKVEELRLGRNNIGHRGLQALGDLRKAKPNLYIDVLDERNLRNADFAPDMKDDAQINVETPKMISTFECSKSSICLGGGCQPSSCCARVNA
ncbi:unnamed protein product [Durusdinium trenchii]|uniref:Uncharacterized protein n=1 Tax=Durusdinium trenchii TaxID=1381693 RepID=A0ABP0MZP9_9DINO